jgi:hypothetical protein
MFRLLAEYLAQWALAAPIERFWTRVMPKSGLDDPVYKKNVRDLIERNRRFEKKE